MEIIKVTDNDIDVQSLKEFYTKHKTCPYDYLNKPFYSSTGGQYSFTVTPTGLGPIVKVKCNACNKEIDITNNSNW